MENLLEDKNVTSAELWRTWKERGKRRDKAIARRIKVAAGVAIGVLALAFAVYEFVKR